MKTSNTIQERLANAEVAELVKNWLGRNKEKGRLALTRYVCEALDLRDHRGRLRVAGAQKALRVLEARGCWKLPKPHGQGPGRWQPKRLGHRVPPPPSVPPRAEQVRGLYLAEVSREQEGLFRTWNELIVTEHPLRNSRLVGRQLRYLIGSDHGW